MIRAFLILLAFLLVQPGFSQSDKEKAYQKGMEGIKLMDEGKYEESIKLMKEAQKLDPERFDYPYEIALATYLMKDYKGAIKQLEKIRNHKDVTVRLYQLLGNAWDMNGDSKKAFEVYDEGLKKFPGSGMLYLEKGNVHWAKKEYNDALNYYEQGIEADPSFPSNYYRAALIYCSSTDEIWGLIYGEIFMNLERNSKRTAEISKLLYDTYKQGITIKSQEASSVSFCKNMVMKVNPDQDPKDVKLPFCMIYEPTLLMSIVGVTEVNMESLSRIRTDFIDNYYKMGHAGKYPNALFEYQMAVKDAGHMEAYHHWILMKGDEDAFDKWQAGNEDKWKEFVKWFTENGMKVDIDHRFYRSQY